MRRCTDVINVGGNRRILHIRLSSVRNAGMLLMKMTECSRSCGLAAGLSRKRWPQELRGGSGARQKQSIGQFRKRETLPRTDSLNCGSFQEDR